MTAPELKPCPFCGGEAEIWRAHEGRTAWIACMGKCVVLISKEYLSDDEAIAAWNRRADLAAVQPAQVRVKPLGSDGVKIHPQDILNAAWRDDLGNEGRAMYDRILAALDPQPDPRDDVIARLVEAATDANQALVDAAEEIAELRLAMSKQDLELPWIGDAIDKLTLSIAAAKAVQL